ncbi:hypothetical protein ACFSTC_58720 [Nonomuraea ferruginea]
MSTQDRKACGGMSWTRGRDLAAAAVVVAVLTAFPGVLPNAVGLARQPAGDLPALG